MVNQSEIGLRIIPAIFGILSIPAIYFVFREVFNENISFICAMLLAVSPFHIYYSQEARMYTLWLFIFLVALYHFIKAIQTNDKKSYIWFGIIAGISTWTHFYTVMFFGILILYAIIKNRHILKELISTLPYSIIPFIVIITPLIPSIFTIITAWPNEQKWFGYMGIYVIPGAILEFFGGYIPMAMAFTITCIIGLAIMYKHGRENFLFVSFVLATTFALAVVLSYKLPMVARYLFVIYPFILLPISVSISSLFDYFEHKRVYMGSLVLILLLLVHVPPIGDYYTYPVKEDHRMESREVSNLTNDGDYFILLTNGRVFQHYYSNETDKTLIFTCQTYDNLIALNEARGNERMIIMPQYDPYGYEKELAWIHAHYDTSVTLENGATIYIINGQKQEK
jgi:uncharacterized membrane protein